jgi:hypothetical protein
MCASYFSSTLPSKTLDSPAKKAQPSSVSTTQTPIVELQVHPKERKPRKSNKAPAVKAAVLVKRANGVQKAQIARDLSISRPTVDAILDEADLDRQIECGTLQCAGLIPESIRVVEHRLGQNSETAAFRLLEGIGVLGPNAKQKTTQLAGLQLNVAIQNLMGQPGTLPNSGATPSTNAIEAKAETEQSKPLDSK